MIDLPINPIKTNYQEQSIDLVSFCLLSFFYTFPSHWYNINRRIQVNLLHWIFNLTNIIIEFSHTNLFHSYYTMNQEL